MLLLILFLFIAVLAFFGWAIQTYEKKKSKRTSNIKSITFDLNAPNGTTTVYEDDDVTITITQTPKKN